MSIDAGHLAQMSYGSNSTFPTSGALGAPGGGFGGRTRLNSKRLSVALPPKVAPISENAVDSPTPRTSRSHLLAGLRTQPKTPGVPASAPYHQTQHSVSGLGASQWADATFANNGYTRGLPQTAHDLSSQYAVHAAQQMYSLPEQVLAPPNMYEQTEEMDPRVLQQMQMQSLFLAQRQQQLQQKLASLTAHTQGMNLNQQQQQQQQQQQYMTPTGYAQGLMTPQTSQGFYGQQQQQMQQMQQMQSPIEVPGQPGVYLVYNPQLRSYTYMMDPAAQPQAQMSRSPVHQSQASSFSPPPQRDSPAPSFNLSPPGTQGSTPVNGRSFTPPKKTSSPVSTLEHVEPLPPPSATAFRRGHKKASSLAINPLASAADGPKTASAVTFGSQRTAFPPAPMTGTFGPGAARAGEHPVRQPRGPPALDELVAAPTSKHEGSKNFATRQRRRALDSLMKAGIGRRGASRSSGGSPVSEEGAPFSISEADEEDEVMLSFARSGAGGRKMSPIGSEMQQQKRHSHESTDGYFGLSSASSSETEDVGAFKQPPTPATPLSAGPDSRKMMMLGVLSAAEKRKSMA
nr:hypothetical protein CFP56_44486 [Quercus suber]